MKMNAGSQDFVRLADRYFDEVYFRYQPTLGTLAGFHQYDSQLENFSRDSLEHQISALHEWNTRLSAIPL